jgi:hypothetical protein
MRMPRRRATTTPTPTPAMSPPGTPSPPFRDLTIGPLSFRMYGLMIALGVLAAVWIARRRYSSYGGDPEFLRAKVVTARFYAEQLLPQAGGLLGAVQAGAADLFAIEPKYLVG